MGSIKQIPFDLFLFHVLLTLHAYYFTCTARQTATAATNARQRAHLHAHSDAQRL